MKPSKNLNIDLDEEICKVVSGELNILLASTYDLYYQTHACHWNVLSAHFYLFHKMFEEQYEALAEAVDEIAERMRQLGHFPAMDLRSLLKSSFLEPSSDASMEPLGSEAMLSKLLKGHETIIRQLRQMIEKAAPFEDEGTVDFLVERLRAHEKTAWMLRSSL